jgi:putative NADPH-quinone reductase
MRILIILAHPDEQSLNHAIARQAEATALANGHEVVFHDLYKEGFDPILLGPEIPRNAPLPKEIASHCAEAAGADGIIVVHPNWWGMPPALLTGWVDRVLRPGVAYEFTGDDGGEGVPGGLLKARTALIFNTSNTEAGREIRIFGDPLERIWKDCVFGLCGVGETHRRMFRTVITSSDEERCQWLAEVSDMVDEFYPRQD